MSPTLVPGPWRPLPKPTWLTEPFWEAAKNGRLIVQRCSDCGSYIFRPQFACTHCFSTDLNWVEASGRGVINSFSAVRRPAYPELPNPYVVVVVEMAEGWYMMSNIIGCMVDDVHIGMRVVVKLIHYGDVALPFVVPQASLP
jgi:uncharacterized protein